MHLSHCSAGVPGGGPLGAPWEAVCGDRVPGVGADVFLSACSITFFFNIYLFLKNRDSDRAQAEEGQREKETQNPKQVPAELSAQSPTRGSNSQTAKS